MSSILLNPFTASLALRKDKPHFFSAAEKPLSESTQKLDYKPFGQIFQQFVNGAWNIGFDASIIALVGGMTFTGQEMDETGLYYYGARYYDANSGRFISSDTIVDGVFDTQGYNRYSYVKNNPVNYSDPSGHEEYDPTDTSNPNYDVTKDPTAMGDMKTGDEDDEQVTYDDLEKEARRLQKELEEVKNEMDKLVAEGGHTSEAYKRYSARYDMISTGIRSVSNAWESLDYGKPELAKQYLDEAKFYGGVSAIIASLGEGSRKPAVVNPNGPSGKTDPITVFIEAIKTANDIAGIVAGFKTFLFNVGQNTKTGILDQYSPGFKGNQSIKIIVSTAKVSSVLKVVSYVSFPIGIGVDLYLLKVGLQSRTHTGVNLGVNILGTVVSHKAATISALAYNIVEFFYGNKIFGDGRPSK